MVGNDPLFCFPKFSSPPQYLIIYSVSSAELHHHGDFLSIRAFSAFEHRPSSLQSYAIVLQLLAIISLNARVADVVAVDPSACGDANGGKICDPGNCCSKDNFCGPPDSHCGAGCQQVYSAPSLCTANITGSGPTGPTTPVCGSQASNQKCPHNQCCSQYGFCGTKGAYCYTGCQSQCRYTPGLIAGIVLGTSVGFAVLCAVAFGLQSLYRQHERRKPVTKKNIDPVHRLYPTDTSKDKDTCLDIVFCHGFAIGDLEKNAWRNTWRTREEPVVCWAEEWLGEDLQGKARVFSLEYDGNVSSDPSKKGHNTDVSEIANNLLHCIFGNGYEIGQSNAVVLLGHSFGGLVIKILVVEAQRLAAEQNPRNAFARGYTQRCQSFLRNIGGFVFYAVPHSGAQNLETYIKNCDNMLRQKRRSRSHDDDLPSLLSNIKAFSRDMEYLSVKFENFVRPNNERHDDVIIYAFTEGLPMTQADLGIIVEHGSAARFSGDSNYKIESANHMNVCQYSSKDEESYRQLLSVLNVVIENHMLQKSHTSTHVSIELVRWS